MWVWRPENGTLGVKASLKKKEPGNVTRKANGKRTKKESFLESQRKRTNKEPRKVSSGRCFRKPRRGESRTGVILFPS